MLPVQGHPSTTVPLVHRSTVRILERLTYAQNLALEEETPLFAADLDFAWQYGGPITRAFLETLRADRGQGVIVDSSLVWLVPGIAHGFESGGMRPRGPLRFVHEPFPAAATGVRADANRNFEAVHRLCVLGLPCTPEVAEGDFAFSTAEEAEAFWLPPESIEARQSEIEHRLSAGSLVLKPIPLGTVVELGWGALRRVRPATSSGFQFVLRATLGDRRPPVNGRRNLSIL